MAPWQLPLGVEGEASHDEESIAVKYALDSLHSPTPTVSGATPQIVDEAHVAVQT